MQKRNKIIIYSFINLGKRVFMEKRLTMLLASLFLCFGMALAQTEVSGTVISQEDGEPVIGATIMVKGTNTGEGKKRHEDYSEA